AMTDNFLVIGLRSLVREIAFAGLSAKCIVFTQ
ncbi:hypothetical protein ABIB07_008832, partial [Bradyrhizobium sp. RT10b]